MWFFQLHIHSKAFPDDKIINGLWVLSIFNNMQQSKCVCNKVHELSGCSSNMNQPELAAYERRFTIHCQYHKFTIYQKCWHNWLLSAQNIKTWNAISVIQQYVHFPVYLFRCMVIIIIITFWTYSFLTREQKTSLTDISDETKLAQEKHGFYNGIWHSRQPRLF